MNLPTKLTVLRIIMTFIIIILLLFPFYYVGVNFPMFKVGNVIISLQYIISSRYSVVLVVAPGTVRA